MASPVALCLYDVEKQNLERNARTLNRASANAIFLQEDPAGSVYKRTLVLADL